MRPFFREQPITSRSHNLSWFWIGTWLLHLPEGGNHTFGLIALTMCAASPAALSPEDIVGTWNMLSTARQLEGSDKVINNLGEHPKGIMIITPTSTGSE